MSVQIGSFWWIECIRMVVAPIEQPVDMGEFFVGLVPAARASEVLLRVLLHAWIMGLGEPKTTQKCASRSNCCNSSLSSISYQNRRL